MTIAEAGEPADRPRAKLESRWFSPDSALNWTPSAWSRGTTSPRRRITSVVVLAITLLAAACGDSTVAAEAERAIAEAQQREETEPRDGEATDQANGSVEDTADPATADPDDAADPDGADEGSEPAGASDGSDGDTSDGVREGDDASSDATEGSSAAEGPASAPSGLPRDLTVDDINCEVPSAADPTALSRAGEAMFERLVASGASIPTYALAVDIDPASGAVTGAMRAEIPAQERTINFRVFAGMEAFDAGLRIDDVRVDGQNVDAVLDTALLSLPAASTGGTETLVELDFSFTIDQMATGTTDIFGALGGDSLQPDEVGLLGRTETGMQLGHWFPVWLPDGIRTDPDPSGFGDIGAFPAANICATITVPNSYQVVTGGARVETTDTSIVEAGTGLRDLSILISDDLLIAGRFVGEVELRVWGPADDPQSLQTVLDHSEASLIALTQAFGPYPWDELEVISAPLGAGVGGMEWPGAIWIEQSMFAGGIPGMGDLGELFGDVDLGDTLSALGGPALDTMLEWTIAHEIGHEWWHATVGNDSIESPAVDEPLAQFSACLAMQRIHPDDWREICEAQTLDTYAQARSLGVPDTAAEQPTDQFESALQYGAIVYGKAPGFYFEAADLLGWDELVASLRSFVDDNSFALVSTNALRSHLIAEAGNDGDEIAALWDRWFREAKGDEDIEISGGFGFDPDALDLDGFDLDLDLEGLDLEGLFGEDFDPSTLFGEDFDPSTLFGEDFDPSTLFGEDLDFFDQLLEDLVENDE